MMLPLNDFEAATAQQLAYERNRDEPNEKDEQDAIKLCSKWNKQRIKENMRAWV